MKRKIQLVLLVFTAVLVGCSKDDIPTGGSTKPTPTYSYQTYSCTGKNSGAKSDSFGLFVEGNSVLFWHYNYQTNCACTVSASFRYKNDSLFITEQDTNLIDAWTYCTCHFPVSSRIDSLAQGKYILSVFKYFTYRKIDSLIYRDTLRIQ